MLRNGADSPSITTCPIKSIFSLRGRQEHDVKGAQAADMDCVFVGGGIHAAALGLGGSHDASAKETMGKGLEALCSELECGAPTYAIERLRV